MSEANRAAQEDRPRSHERAQRVKWLGGRDSNPDNVLQRHASYRWTTSQSWYSEAGLSRRSSPWCVSDCGIVTPKLSRRWSAAGLSRRSSPDSGAEAGRNPDYTCWAGADVQGHLTPRNAAGALLVLVLGVEVAIDVVRHIAVVPELRAMTFSSVASGPGTFLIGPGVGVRW